MNVLELKAAYLKYMGEHAPIWANRRPTKLIDSPSPDNFASDGYSNWFARRLIRDPWSSEAFSHCARCLTQPQTGVEPPFIIMVEGVGWNMFNRRKAIKDNFGFIREAGLDPSKLKVSVWKGGSIIGSGLGPAGEGAEFRRSHPDGIDVPADEESISAWKECGLTDGQIIALGESGKLEPSGHGVVHLEGDSPFAGIRSGIYYPINGRYVEIGQTVVDHFVKRAAAARMRVAAAAVEDDIEGGRFLLRLKARTIIGGLVAERMALAIQGGEGVHDLAPYRELETLLVQRGRGAGGDRARIQNAVALIPAVVWLTSDGANLSEGNSRTRLAKYRDILETVISTIKDLGLDDEEIYLALFKQTCDFYAADDDFKSIAGIEATCLDEVKKQRRRMKTAR